MEHSLEARLWRLVPPPGWIWRFLLLALAVGLIAIVGRSMARFALVPLAAVFLWLGLDVLFGASLLHAYKAVARKYKAMLKPDPFPRGPRVEWRDGVGATPDAWCVIGPLADGVGGRVTRTRMILQSLPSLGASLEITSGRAPSGGGSSIPVPPGEPALGAVVPWGYDAGAAEELLDGYTTERVRTLARMAGKSGLRILVMQDRIIVDVGRVLRRASSLDAVIETCLAVRDRARELARGGKVAFKQPAAHAPTPRPADAPPTCPVCAAPFGDGRLLQCDTCSTPHHADCFEWTGRCGVFQCTGDTANEASLAKAS